jgi:hypothetical protein
VTATGIVNLKAPEFKAIANFTTEYKMGSVVFQGVVVDPSGRPKVGLIMAFSTAPDSASANLTTTSLGVWQVTDTKIIPQV